jgi:hypothetical protein
MRFAEYHNMVQALTPDRANPRALLEATGTCGMTHCCTALRFTSVT